MIRFQLALECTLVLFSLSAGPGAYQVWRHQAEVDGAYWMVVGVPASAAGLFLFLSVMIPGLYGRGELKFPGPLTLAAAFTSLLPTCAALWLTTPEELMSNFELFLYARLWEQPGELLITLGAQVLGLSLLGLLRRVQ